MLPQVVVLVEQNHHELNVASSRITCGTESSRVLNIDDRRATNKSKIFRPPPNLNFIGVLQN